MFGCLPFFESAGIKADFFLSVFSKEDITYTTYRKDKNMVFSSIPFLFYFLPAVIVAYFVAALIHRKVYANAVLLASSLLFYAWGEPKYMVLMVASTVIGFGFSLITEMAMKTQKKALARLSLILAVGINLAALGVFKYADFAIGGVNTLFGLDLTLPGIALPIGISFYTFQILSYCVDVYRGDVPAQKNIINFAAYVTMFPQLIAGPIVRYKDVNKQLEERTYSFEKVYLGLQRFIIGLSKKVLLANILGELCSTFKASEENTVLFAWMYAVAYALHVYFDFSGYSDMAIGIGKVFGFDFIENFNYPYISKSATEFWRRWHMSLGTWFRDYVYIPMGGNRVPFVRWILNILTVWALTGLWHGASMTFVVWGLYFAVLLVLEKLFIKKLLEKLPAFISHIYTLLAVFISFIIFDAENFSVAGKRLAMMFGFGADSFAGVETLYNLRNYAVVFIIGIIAAMPVAKVFKEKVKLSPYVAMLLCAVLFTAVTAFLVDGSFNPFLYFRF